MARSVTFGGQTQFKPGGLTNINASGMSSIGLSARGIVHLLGEADGGAPGSTGVQIIDDPALAPQIFRSGPLPDAVKIAFGASGDARIPGGAFRCVCYKTNNSTQSGTQLPGTVALISDTAAAGTTTTVVNLTTGGLTVDAHIGRWLEIDSIRRRITNNTATAVTVSPGFPEAYVATTPVKILNSQIELTSVDYGAHTNQTSVELEAGVGTGFVVTLAQEDKVEQSDEIGGTPYLRMKYVGGTVDSSGTVTSVASGGATMVYTTTDTPSGADAWAGMFVRFANGLQRLILHNTAAPSPITVTFATGHELSADEITDVTAGAAEIINCTSATVSITGASGSATAVSATVAPTADACAFTFDPGMTLRQFVSKVNGTTNFEAVIPDGVNPDTTLMSSFDFDARNTSVDVRFDDAISPTTKGSFRRDLQVLVDWINTYSTLVAAAKADTATTEGSGLPDWTGGVSGIVRDVPVYFIGGSRGRSTNSSFQSGFDALIQERGNQIVPLIAEDLANEGLESTAELAVVAAQLKAHVARCRTTGKNEMGGYLGFHGTKTAFLAQVAALNDTDVQLIPEQMAFLDSANNLTLQPEWGAAVAAAGMRSGTVEVGEPLTFKYIATSQLVYDSSWSPKNLTDVNQLLAGGVLFAEQTPSGLVRWVRDITTYIQDDNDAYINGDTREAVRFVAYDLRKSLEDKFTGLKATPATTASIREHVAAKCAEYLAQNIIVTSLDPETHKTWIPGFRKLRVTIDGNVATIRLEIFPCMGIVFELNDISLQLPRMSA